MDTAKNDRINSLTRIVSASVIFVLLLAFFALYIAPDHTDIDFSWTIKPRTSAILIGAGYTAGAFFFVRLLGQKKWHRVQAGFLPITAFTICMLTATFLHWSRFRQGSFAFYLWTITYAITPFIVPLLWWQNHPGESNDLEEDDLRFSPLVRWLLGIFAAIGILTFVVIFIQPSILISVAPWKLTELTARIFAGWSILTFATILSIASDGRWSATRILLESAMVGIGLTLLGLPRMWNDFDQASPMTYFFVAGITLALMAFIVVHLWLDKASRNKQNKSS
jgi:hypothetical protein